MFSNWFGFTAPQRISSFLNEEGIDFVFLGRSLIWPTLDLTTYSSPRILDIVLTFVGDSTITKGFDMSLLITVFW